MLDPYDRRHLMEILRPPEGYSLDFAIGTTFSLDLLALLTTPLSFTIFEAECESRTPDPLALFESLRRYAGKICIFCHAGRIHIPKEYGQPFYSLLEGSVFQALPQSGDGSFHPKIWALRYTSLNEPVAYRFLCLSRNLTYDRSWDTALVFDGILADRENAFASNHPIGDFLASLPGMVEEGLPEDLQNRINRMQYEIRRVAFDLPSGFEKVAFHPLGIDNKKANPISGRIDRMLVVSPFLTESSLNRLASLGKESVLVSRLDSMQKVPADCLRRFSELFCLKDDAILEEDGSDNANPGPAPTHIETEQAFVEDNLDGLHVKLYVADAGREGRIWTGSANATDAAFRRNIEFLVELRGKKKYCGVDAVLNGGKETEDGKLAGLRILLDPVAISDVPIIDENEPLKHLANEARNALVKAGLSARVSQDADEHFSIFIDGGISYIPDEASVTCRPITLPKARAIHLSAGLIIHAEFKQLLVREISAFFAFDLTVRSGGKSLTEGFVLKLPLEGAPEDRYERILRDMLKDKSQVLRLMLLILSLERGSDPADILAEGSGFAEAWKWRTGEPPGIVPLFECMVRAVARDPQRIDELNSLIQDLKGHLETRDLLPDGLDEIWGPIWEARKMMGGVVHEEN
jgi:hypothetical protein